MWVVKMRRASRGFHLSSCAMLPCTRPTRSGVPSRVERSVARSAGCPSRRRSTSTTAAAAIASCARRPAASSANAIAGIDERHEAGETVDAEHARELRDGQHLHLAVAERHPRKAAEQVAAQELRGRPMPPARATAPRRPARLTRRLTISAVSAGNNARYAASSSHREQRHRRRQPAECARPRRRSSTASRRSRRPRPSGPGRRRAAAAGRAAARAGRATRSGR